MFSAYNMAHAGNFIMALEKLYETLCFVCTTLFSQRHLPDMHELVIEYRAIVDNTIYLYILKEPPPRDNGV